MTDPAVPEPLWTDCEGSDCPTHLHGLGSGICSMCGSRVPIWADDGKAKDHKRKDVLAMLDRGDFG